MANMTIPTSRDIYLELNGKKWRWCRATAQGLCARAEIEAFGESEPVATVGGQTRYTLELSRLYATDEAIGDGVSFYELDDFPWWCAARASASSTAIAAGATSRSWASSVSRWRKKVTVISCKRMETDA